MQNFLLFANMKNTVNDLSVINWSMNLKDSRSNS